MSDLESSKIERKSKGMLQKIAAFLFPMYNFCV